MSMPHSEVKECENHQSWRDLIIGGAVMYAQPQGGSQSGLNGRAGTDRSQALPGLC